MLMILQQSNVLYQYSTCMIRLSIIIQLGYYIYLAASGLCYKIIVPHIAKQQDRTFWIQKWAYHRAFKSLSINKPVMHAW